MDGASCRGLDWPLLTGEECRLEPLLRLEDAPGTLADLAELDELGGQTGALAAVPLPASGRGALDAVVSSVLPTELLLGGTDEREVRPAAAPVLTNFNETWFLGVLDVLRFVPSVFLAALALPPEAAAGALKVHAFTTFVWQLEVSDALFSSKVVPSRTP